MDYKKTFMFLIPAAVGLIVLAAIMHVTSILVISTSFMVIGFYLIGLSVPDMLDKWIDSGYSVLVPIAFSLIAVIGTVFQASSRAHSLSRAISSASSLLLSFSWCPKAPCMPLLFLVMAFVAGNLANWAGHILNNDEIEILTWR